MARRTKTASRRWTERTVGGRRPAGGATQAPTGEPRVRTAEPSSSAGAGPYEFNYDISLGYDSGRSILLP